jgi:hypothetical protein
VGTSRAHLSNVVKQKLQRRGIKTAVIPGVLTSCLQAGDIGSIPSSSVVQGWVKTAWNGVPTQVVEKCMGLDQII